jgi:poly(hydroxyalkanoate) granule-associated protein
MTRKTSPNKSLNAQFNESLHNVRFAVLGAYGMARKEAARLTQALVDEGKRRETETRKAAEARIEAAREEAGDLVHRVEQLVESRVERTLKVLGVATRDDVHALSGQVDKLTRQVNKLNKQEDVKAKTAA